MIAATDGSTGESFTQDFEADPSVSYRPVLHRFLEIVLDVKPNLLLALAHFVCWLRLGSMQDTQPQDFELSATIHLAFEEL